MIIFFDGGCIPNPGIMEAAIVSECGTINKHTRLGCGTNNEAEWIALLMAVEEAKTIDTPVTIKGDSTLVVNQALGLWKCKQPHLQKYLTAFKRHQISNVEIMYVPRNANRAGHLIEDIQKARKR